MIDYYKTYKRFIGIKNAGKFSKQDGHAKKLERHHIVPKSLGGKTDPANLVWLSEYDHCIAHFLLQFANVQHNNPLINYSPRNHEVCRGDRNIVTYWNPLSKIKFEIRNGEDVQVKTLLEAAKYVGKLSGGVATKKQRKRNRNIARLIGRATSPENKGTFKYFGMKWKIIF